MFISFQQFGWKMQAGHKIACLLDMMHNIKQHMQITHSKMYGNFLPQYSEKTERTDKDTDTQNILNPFLEKTYILHSL